MSLIVYKIRSAGRLYFYFFAFSRGKCFRGGKESQFYLLRNSEFFSYGYFPCACKYTGCMRGHTCPGAGAECVTPERELESSGLCESTSTH